MSGWSHSCATRLPAPAQSCFPALPGMEGSRRVHHSMVCPSSCPPGWRWSHPEQQHTEFPLGPLLFCCPAGKLKWALAIAGANRGEHVWGQEGMRSVILERIMWLRNARGSSLASQDMVAVIFQKGGRGKTLLFSAVSLMQTLSSLEGT